MKKIVLSTALAMSLVVANEYQYEITPKIGYVDTKEHVDIENHNVFGLGVARNMGDDCKFDKLEFSLLQSGTVDYENNSPEDTKITILGFNGIKEYKLSESFNLYALAGLGYEHISDSHYNNESDPFFNYGVGAAYSLTKELSLQLDVRHELKFDGDKNVIYTLGLAIPFGKIAPQKVEEVVPPVVEEPVVPEVPEELDSDNDGVVDSKDHCRSTKEDAEVDANGCTIIPLIDTDKDGILDSIDQCPKTAMGVQVDHNGCALLEIPQKIQMTFDTNSDVIKSADLLKLDSYVTYAKKVDNTTIVVEAHTDSVGTKKYNQTLSQKRAQSVKEKLISLGLNEKTIKAIGYGETQPLVSNDTPENRAENRRVTLRIEK